MAKDRGSLRTWRPTELKSLELRLGTSFHHSYPRHCHDEFFVSAITAGAGHFLYHGKDHVAVPGNLVLVAPGDVHAHYDCDGGRSFRSIHIAPSFVTELERELLHCPGSLSDFQSSLISDTSTLDLFLKLHKSLETSVTRLHYETLMLGFFTQLSQHASRNRSNARTSCDEIAVKCALQYLHEHYDQAISLRDLAALAKMSPYHFHRVFCRATGMPPHAYQIQLRVMRAKLLLTRLPIATVATLTGFVDQSHFHRSFKRIMGVTPGQYANQGKKVQDGMVTPH